jgi:hypothetical protein
MVGGIQRSLDSLRRLGRCCAGARAYQVGKASLEEFHKNGAKILERVGQEQPGTFMKVLAMLCPREVKLEHHRTYGNSIARSRQRDGHRGKPRFRMDGSKLDLHFANVLEYSAPGQALSAPSGSASKLLAWLERDRIIAEPDGRCR